MTEAARGGHGVRLARVIWLVTALVLAGFAEPPEPGAADGPGAYLAAGPEPAATPAGKSPGRAVLLSLAIPGGGQVYTGYWWKAALIAPAELTLAALAVREHGRAAEALRAGDEPGYIIRRDRRNTLLYFTGTVLAYAMADAWVSARMYAFDEQMELAARCRKFLSDRGFTFAFGPGRAGVTAGL